MPWTTACGLLVPNCGACRDTVILCVLVGDFPLWACTVSSAMEHKHEDFSTYHKTDLQALRKYL